MLTRLIVVMTAATITATPFLVAAQTVSIPSGTGPATEGGGVIIEEPRERVPSDWETFEPNDSGESGSSGNDASESTSSDGDSD